ncbi:hypothetical protein Y032_0298g1762 [Ancylostoma ceylanicum]|uniref:Uncharacterized protein n=1 Tax=Ancylostoma ceylanicum TaxID=53326 RepID=A0A016S450_9BILA|nr:hypothetical protein Y032_0298g1762 [Ancylostoma ceylanicum]
MHLLLLCLVSLLPLLNASFLGCGGGSSGCGGSSYGYGFQQASYPTGYGYGYRQTSYSPAYGYGYRQVSYPPSYGYGYGYQQQGSYATSYGSFSSYPPGQISGYILRAVGPAQATGYAVAGGYTGGGVPVTHSRYGQIGYVTSPYGSLPTGPYYWQPSAGAPYERVSVGSYAVG